MLELVFVAFWLVFICLAFAGVGLLLAVIFTFARLPEPLTQGLDAATVQRGRWRGVRRYAAWWLVSTALWLAAGQLIRVFAQVKVYELAPHAPTDS